MAGVVRPRVRGLFLVLTLLLGTAAGAMGGENVRVSGSTTVNPPVADAAEALGAERGMTILIDTAGGSTGGINAMGDGRADVGMTSRAINEADLAKYPEVNFVPTIIGRDAISMVVSRDVWEGGVESLTADQLQGIYEGRIRNWKEVGGPDRRIVFFNKEPGRGTWEMLVGWLYKSPANAPRVNHPEVGANAEVRSKVGGTRGALSFVSTPWADQETVFALALVDGEGTEVAVTGENIASGAYPLTRPLYLVTNGTPADGAKVLVDYLLSEAGQSLVEKHGFLKREDSQ